MKRTIMISLALLTLSGCRPELKKSENDEQSIGSLSGKARIAIASVRSGADVGWCYLFEDPSFKPKLIQDGKSTASYTLRQYRQTHRSALQKSASAALTDATTREQMAARDALGSEVNDAMGRAPSTPTKGALCDFRVAVSEADSLLSTLEKLLGRLQGSASTGKPSPAGKQAVQCNNGEASIARKPTVELTDSGYTWLTSKLQQLSSPSSKHTITKLSCPAAIQEYEIAAPPE